MKTQKEIERQIALAYIELYRIEHNVPVGSGAWSKQKGYIDGLEYTLDKE